MTDAVLVLNAGSSSIKFSLYSLAEDAPVLDQKGQIEGIGTSAHFQVATAEGHRRTDAERRWTVPPAVDHEQATAHLLRYIGKAGEGRVVRAVGHRVVHGGTLYDQPTRLDPQIVEQLAAFVPLAPLHQPHNLAPIRSLMRSAPELTQVACFDTAFHRGMPEVAQAFALPRSITDRGVRRYGFHGLSYEYITAVLPKYDAVAAEGRVVVAHLGNGASMCAIRGRQSVASTMGFTAVEGLPMGTRSGSLDPGVLIYLMDELGMDARALERLLYRESGLLGVSGVSSDMRTLLASTNLRAREAIDLFVYRIGRELGSLAAALGGIDALVFTGGIGENAAYLRERVLVNAGWLGFACDTAANAGNGPRLSPEGHRPSAWAIPTDEELMIARHTIAVLEESR